MNKADYRLIILMGMTAGIVAYLQSYYSLDNIFIVPIAVLLVAGIYLGAKRLFS